MDGKQTFRKGYIKTLTEWKTVFCFLYKSNIHVVKSGFDRYKKEECAETKSENLTFFEVRYGKFYLPTSSFRLKLQTHLAFSF